MLLVAVAIAAQEPVIDADRPHIGTGPHVVEPGEVQVEAGIQWQQSDSGLFGSPALIRAGVVDRVELRAATENIARALWASGLNDQEPAGIYSHNDARVLFSMLGILRAGAAWVPEFLRTRSRAVLLWTS